MRALLALLACCSQAAPPARTAVAMPGDVVERVVLTGALHPVSAATVFVPPSEQSSMSVRWLIADGTAVKAGDRIAELDGSALAAPLAELHGQLKGWDAQYRLAIRSDDTLLASKQYELARARIEVERAALRAAVPADIQLARAAQDAQARLRRAKSALAADRADLASTIGQAALGRKVQEIAGDKTKRAIANAEEALASLVLRAPRDGIVVIESRDGRKLRAGEMVVSGMSIATLPDLDKPVEVVAELSDVDDGKVSIGMTGTCTLDAYPGEAVPCTVASIAPVAHTLPGHDGSRRSFSIALSLAHADARMRPGMAFEVELARPTVHGLVVPRGAVFAGEHVRLASGEIRVVTVGRCDSQRCTIARGLDAGDVVAIGGAS